VTGRQGRKYQQLLYGLNETREFYKLKEEALDRALWRTRFERIYGPVVGQTTTE
jgi:hypothetical protein